MNPLAALRQVVLGLGKPDELDPLVQTLLRVSGLTQTIAAEFAHGQEHRSR